MDSGTIQELKARLINSHWPKCHELAQSLMSIGGSEAKEALVEALNAKRHHIRTASIRALVGFSDPSVVSLIRPHLNDPSYETRMEAKAAIKRLTGQDVLTARGE